MPRPMFSRLMLQLATLLVVACCWMRALARLGDLTLRGDGRSLSNPYVGASRALLHLDRIASEEASLVDESRVIQLRSLTEAVFRDLVMLRGAVSTLLRQLDASDILRDVRGPMTEGIGGAARGEVKSCGENWRGVIGDVGRLSEVVLPKLDETVLMVRFDLVWELLSSFSLRRRSFLKDCIKRMTLAVPDSSREAAMSPCQSPGVSHAVRIVKNSCRPLM